MNLLIVVSLAVSASSSSEIERADLPAPRVSPEEVARDREVVSRAGILGLLREMEGSALRVVFSMESIDTALDRLATGLTGALVANSDPATARRFDVQPAASVSIGAVRAPKPAEVRLERRRSLGPGERVDDAPAR